LEYGGATDAFKNIRVQYRIDFTQINIFKNLMGLRFVN
jgi:hypothetical protein